MEVWRYSKGNSFIPYELPMPLEHEDVEDWEDIPESAGFESFTDYPGKVRSICEVFGFFLWTRGIGWTKEFLIEVDAEGAGSFGIVYCESFPHALDFMNTYAPILLSHTAATVADIAERVRDTLLDSEHGLESVREVCRARAEEIEREERRKEAFRKKKEAAAAAKP